MTDLPNPAFNGTPLVAGVVRGLRSFRVDTRGYLTGVTMRVPWITTGDRRWYEAWHLTSQEQRAAELNHTGKQVVDLPATNLITQLTHRVAALDCVCGIYGYFDQDDYSRPDGTTVSGIIEGAGRITAGSQGFRAERGRLVALVEPPSINRWQADALADRLIPRSLMEFVSGTLLAGGAIFTVLLAVERSSWAFVAASFTLSSLFGHVRMRLAARAYWRSLYRANYIDRDLWAKVQRVYPDVPIYPNLGAALRAHPLSSPMDDAA